MLHYSTIYKTLAIYDIRSVCQVNVYGVYCISNAETLISNQNTDRDYSQILSDSEGLPAVVVEICNWSKYDISIHSFHQEVYGPGPWHVSEQSYASDPSFEESDMFIMQ